MSASSCWSQIGRRHYISAKPSFPKNLWRQSEEGRGRWLAVHMVPKSESWKWGRVEVVGARIWEGGGGSFCQSDVQNSQIHSSIGT